MTSITKKSFRISLILHLNIFSLLIIFTLFRSCKKEPKPYVFTIVSPPSQTTNQNTSSPSNTSDSKPQAKASPEKPKAVTKEETPKQSAKPKAAKKKLPKKEPELKRISYRDFQKKHNKHAQESVKPAQKKIVTPKLNLDDITSELENIVLSGSASQLTTYIGHIRQRVDSIWRAPSEVTGNHIQATVSFRVNPAGNLSHIRLLTSSGNRAFDNSILAAFKELSNVSPPPKREAYTFQLTFKLNQA